MRWTIFRSYSTGYKLEKVTEPIGPNRPDSVRNWPLVCGVSTIERTTMVKEELR
jgi:hypothetical protein